MEVEIWCRGPVHRLQMNSLTYDCQQRVFYVEAGGYRVGPYAASVDALLISHGVRVVFEERRDADAFFERMKRAEEIAQRSLKVMAD